MQSQLRWPHLLTEFTMVFLGVLFAFFFSNWAERSRDHSFVRKILYNLQQDIQTDTSAIAKTQFELQQQYDSISLLIELLRNDRLSDADRLFHWTYKLYLTFYPTTQTFESIVSSGDMKLLDDHDCLRNLKAMAIANERLIRVQEYYRISIATFRSDFIVRYNINDFHFSDIPQQERRRFWNSLKFHSSMIKGYYDVIHDTKRIYENVLDTMPVLEK